MKSFLLPSVLLIALSLSATAQQNVAWVSFHPGNDTPSTNAGNAGFTRAPDAGYTDLLTANGYNVTRIVTSATPDAMTLNNYDLVIISRSVPSANYQNAGATAWNSITAPTLELGGYVLRNSRMGYTTGGTMVDTLGDVALQVTDTGHPIFAGLSLSVDNTLPYAVATSFNATTQLGISVNTDPLAGGGVLLGTVGGTGVPAAGGMLAGEWQAGSIMGDASADVLAGHRMVLLTGTREAGITSEGAGIYDLTPEGSQLFLNAVGYMAVPEPTTLALLVPAFALAMGRRRRQR